MLLRRVARPLLAGIFIAGGISELREPKAHAELIGPVMDPVVDQVGRVAGLERRPEITTLVKVDAGIKIGAGVLLATGKLPRLAAGTLAATLIPVTAFGHRFWEIDDPDRRTEQQIHFLKNLGLLGGLLLASADTEGKPSLAWRARRARMTSAATAELFHRDVTEGLSGLARKAGAVGAQAAEATGRVGSQAAEAAGRVGSQTAGLAGRLSDQATEAAERLGGQAVEVAERLGGQAADVAGRVSAQTGRAVDRYGDEATQLVARYRPKAEELADLAGSRLAKHGERLRERSERIGARATRRAEKLAVKASKQAKRAAKRAAKQARKARRKLRARV